MDKNKIEKQIQELIDSGKIKSIEDLMEIPIDKIQEKTGICAKEFACYVFCNDKCTIKCDKPLCKWD